MTHCAPPHQTSFRSADPGAFDDDDLEGGGDDEAESGRPKRQRAPRAQGSTLVDFNDKIKVKKLELEFTVDPLFSKTCADFDEGGAAGILCVSAAPFWARPR